MAKHRGYEQDNGSDKGKIRFVYAEVEGNNQSLQDLMKTMIAAMNRPTQIAAPPKKITNSVQPPADAQPAEETLFDRPETPVDDPESVPLDAIPRGSNSGRVKRGDGPKTDRNAGINLVPDLDFVPDGKEALKVFFAGKAPGTDLDQVLVISYYLQHVLDLQSFGPGHILTGFKHVGKPVPVDLRQTIRNMKKGKAWLNFTELDAIRVTTEGENRVEHELGQTQNG